MLKIENLKDLLEAIKRKRPELSMTRCRRHMLVSEDLKGAFLDAVQFRDWLFPFFLGLGPLATP